MVCGPVMSDQPLNILAIASYFKGERFLRQAHARGAKVYLLTVESLLQEPWPRDVLADVFAQRDAPTVPGEQEFVNTVSYLARNIRFDRIVAMDDFDVEVAAALREHLRIPGMGDTTARHFRDKLAMRVKAKEEGIPVPEFVHVLNYDALREYMAKVPPPWMFKPRFEASTTGIIKVESPEQLWRVLDEKGDKQSYFLLEKYLPGDVYHCDSIVWDRKTVFCEAHRCGKPPFNVAHGGGIFTTSTLPRGSEDEKQIKALNEQVLQKLNMVRGVNHVEFIKRSSDGKFFMLESAARVGGAHIAETIEGATGVNLWQEWANVEVDYALGKPYQLEPARQEYGGLAISLAKQEHPDLSAYDDPEIFYRAPERQHVGLVLRSKDHARIQQLLDSYQERFVRDFTAVLPAKEKSLQARVG